MVLFITKYDIHPDKIEAYNAWAKTAIPAVMKVPGMSEFRAYRPVTGGSQIVTVFEFADLTSWETFFSHDEYQRLLLERRAFILNEVSEVWGPSPLVPEPLRPGG
jgi:antibiotic biosynthesis monooxygenase (ABM) superfamily enzyme